MSDPTAARVEAALIDSVRAGECGQDVTAAMIGHWVLVGVYADQNGQERHMLVTADRQPLHATLGLLRTGDVVWGADLRRWAAEARRKNGDDQAPG